MKSQTVLVHGSTRTFRKLQPSQWGDHFLNIPLDELELNILEGKIKEIKPKVRDMLMSSSPVEGHDLAKKKTLLIYLLTSLGVAYHFENEIEETLTRSFEKIDDLIANEHDLHTISTIFWVFRSYGHNMSSDVFKRFKGDDGKFMESLTKDIKGMLSLYEASHLRTTTDYILDEALSFTMGHLESSAEQASPHLSKLINSALGLAQHWNMEILVAMEYLSFYEQEEHHDKTLLNFSKLNFYTSRSLKSLQSMYYHQLITSISIFFENRLLEEFYWLIFSSNMYTRWYKEFEFASKLPPFFRDRIVELHFFVISMYFEPQFSNARIMLTKFYTAETIIDDTFDRYASLSEAESLAKSLERWAPDDDMDRQPGYLKFVFKFILDLFQEFEAVVRSEGRSYIVKATLEE